MADIIGSIVGVIILCLVGGSGYLLISGIAVCSGILGQPCPSCKRWKLLKISEPVSEPSPFRRLVKLQYQCKSCGYSKHEFVSVTASSGWSGGGGGATGGGAGCGGCG